MPKQIILIGGMPTAGKSTLAEDLSKHLGLPWISNDQMGVTMRAVASRERYPALFTWEDYDGFQYLNKLTADEIADNEFVKGESIWPGVRQLIIEDHSWNNGFIVEGDDILPHLVARDFPNSPNIRTVFIGDLDRARVRNVVFNRNFVGEAARAYPDDFKEREVEWILDYGAKLRSQVLRYKMPWIDVQKDEHDLAKVLSVLEGQRSIPSHLSAFDFKPSMDFEQEGPFGL